MTSVTRIPILTAIAALIGVLFTIPAAAQDTSSIVGVVVDSDGRPVPDARVRLVDPPRVVRTADDGSFRFGGLPAGSYLLEATDPRSGRRVERVTVGMGAAAEITLQLDRLYHLDELVVTTGPERQLSESYLAVNVLSGRELGARATSSIGETLANEPGVTSSYFGPGASRPIIRGLSGDRIRLLEGGVTTGDASSTSPDHAVSIEPMSAERIEIVRGPATLLYGSSAVGGVVNVIDGRIPREAVSSGRPIEGSVYGLGATVSEEFTGGGEIKLGPGPLVIHLSGMRRETDDYDIPGFAEAEPEPGEAIRGTLPNSFVETTRGAAGVSYVGHDGFLGVSWSGLDSQYGVPGEEGVSIDLQQRRVDGEGGWSFPGQFVQRMKARLGYSNYRHFEIEGNGEIGTRFENDQWEGRLELAHRFGDRVSGTLGTQIGNREFSAVGEEAFVPPTDTDLFAVFLFEEFQAGSVRYQLGARYETQNATDQNDRIELDHDGFSFSGGVNWLATDGLNLVLSGARSVKVPSPEELFSNGPHLATGSFEVGDPALDTETAWSLDGSARFAAGRFRGEVTGFVNSFDDFIFQDFTGDEEDGLPVLLYRQTDTEFLGLETQGELELLHRSSDHLAVTARLDWVRAKRTDNDEPLPRIPAVRVGGGLLYESPRVRGSFDVTRHTEQDRVGPFEDATDGFTMVDASASYRLFTGYVTHEILLRGTNLGDVEARSHVSLLKSQAPLPGRSVALVYRLLF